MTHDVTKTPAENLLVDLKKVLPDVEYARAYTVIMALQRAVLTLSTPSVPASSRRGVMHLNQATKIDLGEPEVRVSRS